MLFRKFTRYDSWDTQLEYNSSYLTSNNVPPLPKRKCWKHLNANTLQVLSISIASIAWSKGAQNVGPVCCYILCTDICSVSCWHNYNPQLTIKKKNCSQFVHLVVKKLLHLTLLANCTWTQVSQVLNTQLNIRSSNVCCLQVKTRPSVKLRRNGKG